MPDADLRFRDATLADVDAAARLHVDGWRTAYADFLPPEVIASRDFERRRRNWAEWLAIDDGLHAIFVAECKGDGVIGVCFGGAADENPLGAKGEVGVLYVDSRRREEGIGTRLLSRMAMFLGERDLQPVTIWSLRDNPYRQLYDALGGVVSGARPVDYDGFQTEEVGYLWPAASAIGRPRKLRNG